MQDTYELTTESVLHQNIIVFIWVLYAKYLDKNNNILVKDSSNLAIEGVQKGWAVFPEIFPFVTIFS